MRRNTKSLEELMKENKMEISNNKQAIEQIEKRIEKRNEFKNQD
jgi:hypothetical protein